MPKLIDYFAQKFHQSIELTGSTVFGKISHVTISCIGFALGTNDVLTNFVFFFSHSKKRRAILSRFERQL